jgi:hypothetical protein
VPDSRMGKSVAACHNRSSNGVSILHQGFCLREIV